MEGGVLEGGGDSRDSGKAFPDKIKEKKEEGSVDQEVRGGDGAELRNDQVNSATIQGKSREGGTRVEETDGLIRGVGILQERKVEGVGDNEEGVVVRQAGEAVVAKGGADGSHAGVGEHRLRGARRGRNRAEAKGVWFVHAGRATLTGRALTSTAASSRRSGGGFKRGSSFIFRHGEKEQETKTKTVSKIQKGTERDLKAHTTHTSRRKKRPRSAARYFTLKDVRKDSSEGVRDLLAYIRTRSCFSTI